MQNITEVSRCAPYGPHCITAARLNQPTRKYKRYHKTHSTYLGLIAYVIQTSPTKSLMFCQIMAKLQAFVSGEKKGLENNVRVCLSSNDCFVKVLSNPDNPNGKRNYWRVDETRITPRLLQRHFKGMRHIFPGLASRDNMEAAGGIRKVKFSSSFSIDSLLKKDSAPQALEKSSAPSSSAEAEQSGRKRRRGEPGLTGIRDAEPGRVNDEPEPTFVLSMAGQREGMMARDCHIMYPEQGSGEEPRPAKTMRLYTHLSAPVPPAPHLAYQLSRTVSRSFGAAWSHQLCYYPGSVYSLEPQYFSSF